MARICKWVVILLLLAIAAGGYSVWRRLDTRVKGLLLPDIGLYAGYPDLPERTQGVRLTPFTVKGWDGNEVQACIVTKAEGSEGLTPRQQVLAEQIKGESLGELSELDYALVCVNWDHGIRSALPLAESLAAAGVKCVLWEPRGAGSVRPYCTHGVQERRDVPAIIDALEQREGREGLLIAGVGEGYGAELLLHAAAAEGRLRSVAVSDAAASLTRILKRGKSSTPTRELISWRMNQLTGLEPFDIAAVKSASLLPRETPVLILYTGRREPSSEAEDAVAIFTQLPGEHKQLMMLRSAKDAPDASVRQVVYVVEGGTREVVHREEATLIDNAEQVPVVILRWLNDHIKTMHEEPPPDHLAP